ncbi:MAG TPA: helix-turn-helix domain-containing protein [Anaeromyxobacteraceae bacterium]|nr:helix-turn-helix domain-containing protein [Anaeromyxobacteraceae bacterium]
MKPLRPDAWMTADEAAAYLGYRTRAALYQAVRRGIVPAHRLGLRRLRFQRAELDAELSRHPSRLSDPAAILQG